MCKVALALVLAALLLPAGAAASTATVTGSTVVITGGPESSDITLGTGLMSTGIRDAAGITAGPGCTQSDATTVSCGTLFGRRVDASLGAGDDKIGTLAGVLGVIHGGPGNDEINGDGDNNQLYGDEGIDVVYGGNGNDLVDGGPGTDQLYGDSFYVDAGGADTLMSRDGERDEVSCGAGYDTVTADTRDSVYVECEQVDRGTVADEPAALPTMTVAGARVQASRSLAKWYRMWRNGSRRTLGPATRLSRTSIKFARVSVRYRGKVHRGWVRTKFVWKGAEVFYSTRGLLR
jgi:hypothetical protein